MATIKARPTLYNGIRMRSRLEADYAAYLDQHGVRWGYEPECFASSDGQWLPDFGSTYEDDGPYAIFTELKPAGLLEHDWGRSDNIDKHLTRMTIAWASQPDAMLELVYWEYGGPEALIIFARQQGDAWFAHTGSVLPLLWTGMGQCKQLKGSPPATSMARPERSTPALEECWPDLVGPGMGAHTVPGELADQVFTIYADSTAWATQTRLLAASLVQALNAVFGPGTVRQIKVRRRPVS